MDLYKRLGNELRALFKDLFNPAKAPEIEKKMAHILQTASQLGGSLSKEAQILFKDIRQFLKNPQDPKLLAIMKKHALHLEQETKEI